MPENKNITDNPITDLDKKSALVIVYGRDLLHPTYEEMVDIKKQCELHGQRVILIPEPNSQGKPTDHRGVEFDMSDFSIADVNAVLRDYFSEGGAKELKNKDFNIINYNHGTKTRKKSLCSDVVKAINSNFVSTKYLYGVYLEHGKCNSILDLSCNGGSGMLDLYEAIKEKAITRPIEFASQTSYFEKGLQIEAKDLLKKLPSISASNESLNLKDLITNHDSCYTTILYTKFDGSNIDPSGNVLYKDFRKEYNDILELSVINDSKENQGFESELIKYVEEKYGNEVFDKYYEVLHSKLNPIYNSKQVIELELSDNHPENMLKSKQVFEKIFNKDSYNSALNEKIFNAVVNIVLSKKSPEEINDYISQEDMQTALKDLAIANKVLRANIVDKFELFNKVFKDYPDNYSEFLTTMYVDSSLVLRTGKWLPGFEGNMDLAQDLIQSVALKESKHIVTSETWHQIFKDNNDKAIEVIKSTDAPFFTLLVEDSWKNYIDEFSDQAYEIYEKSLNDNGKIKFFVKELQNYISSYHKISSEDILYKIADLLEDNPEFERKIQGKIDSMKINFHFDEVFDAISSIESGIPSSQVDKHNNFSKQTFGKQKF